jgi:glycosyltransferase involved in cell wall biosynthesis
MPHTVALCMIVKNEESNLQTCLDSVRGIAEECVIVDTGSTDATVAIAASNGAKLIPFDFTVIDFSAARNTAIAHSTAKWIFVLDADETLHPGSVPLIREIIARNEDAGYYVARQNNSIGTQETTIDHAVRLFRNKPANRYRGRVHETIDAAILSAGGHLRKTEIRIDHRFSFDPEARRRKNHWYIGILLEEIAANPSDDTRLGFLAAEYHQLEMFDEAAEIAERIVLARPRDATAHLNAGIYHLVYRPDLKRARSDFEQALSLRPDYPEALSFLESLAERERAELGLPNGT